MSIIGFPLLLIPIAICNIVVFLMPGVGFDAVFSRIPLPSGAVWTLTAGDILVAFGVLMLLFEVIKAGRPGARYFTDHLLSLLVLGGTVAEFVMLPPFANATVFLLATLMLVDFLAGIALRHRSTRKARTAPAVAQDPPQQAATTPSSTTPEPKTPEPTTPESMAPVVASSAPTDASTSAASIAEAVLLDRPQPVAAAAASPRVQSPRLQPAEDVAAGQPQR
ncbi:hypothetical protein SR870_17805 [Rhodopseudomonas palustris]|uniref:hypothetical protein n=1 Tax=Rhodopseudomonas palustris TaxID=1076 RepID=UPI002ACE4335|nr:hypothetical protein [Rhodopseudomonas palustris]WQG98537.1 hypothetical protein SR870_17805 [Rhodopseudomonas palustris]